MKSVKAKNEILLGSGIALVATIAAFILYMEVFVEISYVEVFEHIVKKGLYGEILTLSALPNLFIFFGFLRKNQEARSKGVLLFTIGMALAIFLIKLL